MPTKKLIIAVFLAALLVMSGCKRRNEFLEMLEATPLPQIVVVEENSNTTNNQNNNNTANDAYVPSEQMSGQPEETVDQGVSYTETTSGAPNTAASGSTASYADVPARNTGGDSGSTDNSSASSSNDIYYPNIIGLTEEEALEKLEYCGIDDVEIEYEASYAEEGTVQYQSFPPDTEGESGEYDVEIIISEGNVPYTVPRSGGVWINTFISSLPQDAQPDVVVIYEYSMTRLADQGIYTIPAEGEENSLGSPITFYVSKGMLVGDYVGFDFALVYPELSQGVAYYRTFLGEYSDTVEKGLIISQNQEPGTVLTSQSRDDELVIVYSLGPNTSNQEATRVPHEDDGELPID